MSRKVIILNVAKPDFREIKTYVKSQFGEAVWNDVNEEFKTTINNIGLNPEAGKEIEELKEFGHERYFIVLATHYIAESHHPSSLAL